MRPVHHRGKRWQIWQGFSFMLSAAVDAVLMDCSFKAALGPPPQLFSQLYCIYRM